MGDNIHLEKNKKFIRKLIDIVLENFTNEQFGVSELVEQFGMSRSQLHRKLKSATGQSVSQFIREIRLEEALKLLQNEDITASEVAYKVGFNSPTYFNTCFHEHFGYPPGEAKHHIDDPGVGEAGISNRGFVKRSLLRRNRTVIIALTVLIAFSLVYVFYLKSLDDKEIVANQIPPKEDSIAVLPLKNWSGDVELEYFSDGMTDAIISQLALIKSLARVVPFTSMSSYKDTDKSISEIAKELDVKNILQGNFQLSGDEVRINLQLLDGSSGNQLWNNEYIGQWNTDEIFKIQSEVTENVAKIMNAKITKSEFEAIQKIPTSNKEAYNLYLKAKFQFFKFDSNGISNAKLLFEQAIALDSSFADPFTGLGILYVYGGGVLGQFTEQEAWQRAKPLFEKAYELEVMNNTNRQYFVKILLMWGGFHFEWDIESVENYHNSLSILEKSDSDFAVYDYIRKTGRHSDALSITDNFIESQPSTGIFYVSKAFDLYFLNEKKEALEILNQHDPLHDDNYFYLMESAKAYYYLGEREKSNAQLTLLIKNFPDRPPIVYWLMAVHAEYDEDNVEIEKNLNILTNLYSNQTSGSPAWFIALYYCHVKDYEKAFEWLQKSYDRHEVEMTWFKEEPLLRPLRTDPRYIELYDKIGFSKILPITPYEE
jgi:TolB-like protein/AraC-like DNA-binding protein